MAEQEKIAKLIYADWAVGSIKWEKTTPAEKKPWLDTADKVIQEAGYGKLPPRKITLDDALKLYDGGGIMGVVDAIREDYAGYVKLADLTKK